MNHIYRTVWSHVSRIWVAVSETVAAHGKTRNQSRDTHAKDRHPGGLRGVALRPLLLTLCLALLPALAMAQPPAPNELPTGGVVSVGQATISQTGSQMQILQSSDKAALNWQSFNIGSSAGVNFQQPSTQSVALNRVAGNDPSQIFGTLSANGKLILINPNGVLFAAGSRVDAGGLIATTKALSDADFMNNHYRFLGGGTGDVRNDGRLVATPDGSILMVADKVINTGTIQVRGGTVGMFSADQMQVSADWKTADVIAPAAAAANTVTANNSGRIDVSGPHSGWIKLRGGRGTTQSSGILLANSEQGSGGVIELSGTQVGLMQGSLTDASGAGGGGQVLAGGDWQGSGDIVHATATYMDPAAVIKVNATTQGDGGKAVLWSDSYTNFRGHIEANGAGGGNGGMVETSGLDMLDANGIVLATGNHAGQWLLDPGNVTIQSTPGGSLTNGVFMPTSNGTSTIQNTIIEDALNQGTSVTISTTAGTGSVANRGVIILNADAGIEKTAGGDANLTLTANRIIDLRGDISSTVGKLNVVLDASAGFASTGSNGAVLFQGNILTNGGDLTFKSGVMVIGTAEQTIRTNGGAVSFGGDLEINNPVDLNNPTNPAGLTIDTTTGVGNGGGAVTFMGKVDSGDSYTTLANATWGNLLNAARSGTVGQVGSSYLAQPMSDLENNLVVYLANFATVALGGQRSGNSWTWSGGPNNAVIFNTTSTGNSPASFNNLNNQDRMYVNWGSPPSRSSQDIGTINFPSYIYTDYLAVNNLGKWVPTYNRSSMAGIRQTVAAPSMLTVNAGAANVTFGDRVGSIKPLQSLTVTGSTNINGKQISTVEGQNYTGPITVGNVPSTLLESTADSLSLDTAMTFNQPGSSMLLIRAAQDIDLNVPINTLTGALSVAMTADTTGNNLGSIRLNAPINTKGGSISLTAASGIVLNNVVLDTTNTTNLIGVGNIAVTNTSTGDIVATGIGASIRSGNNITVTNGPNTGVAGTGSITLQTLSGAAVTVSNNADGIAAGAAAVTLNGTTSASGAINVTSRTGDIAVNANIITAANGNDKAVVLGAGTTTLARDPTGGDVRMAPGIRVQVNPTSRAIIYTGSIAGSVGVTPGSTGSPGTGNYRYDVVYGDTNRLPTTINGTTFVQYREQPVLDLLLPDRDYNAEFIDGTNWINYVDSGWANDDGPAVNPLKGALRFDSNAVVQARDARTYTVDNGSLTDTLGYQLNVRGDTNQLFTINRKIIPVSDLIVTTRQYDGGITATIDGGNVPGVFGPDIGLVDVFGSTGEFDDKNAGVGKLVHVQNVVLHGSRSFNYDIDLGNSTTTGTILPKELRLAGIRPLDRVYDGTTDATFVGTPVLTGIIPGEEADVHAPLDQISGRFADKNAGHNKQVVEDLSTAILSGNEAHNYTIVGIDASVNTATIFPAQLIVNAVPVVKIFDGMTDSHVDAVITGLFPGDAITGSRLHFDSASAGQEKILAVSPDFTIHDGNDGNNYNVDFTTSRGEIKAIPMPHGSGQNPIAPDTKNLDLMSLAINLGGIQRGYQQADYFLHPGTEERKSSTHAAMVTD